MVKRNIISGALIFFILIQATAQVKSQQSDMRREVTLYNPYKPSLPDVKKRSYLPDMKDTTKIRPEFRYDIKTVPFVPEYTISPIKAASLMPDPLPKLYKSYINIGLGNYFTPLAEVSITNERSKKGALGFYGRHLSSSGKVKLQNDTNVFAGYMDNDVSLFGKKFFRKSLFESSIDLTQKTRYAYGYNTDITGYSADKKEIRLSYTNIGAKASLSSITLDSASFSYDFDIWYNYFFNGKNLFEHNFGFNGIMAKSYKGFYVGSEIDYDFYRTSDSILTNPEYIASITPFIKKSNEQWSFKLGFKALIDKNMTESPALNIYPDINFSFNVVPTYINFFAGLSGKMEKNVPLKIISENPYLLNDGTLFTLPDTDHELIVFAGLKGNTGLGGNYRVSASYSLVRDMVFYSNLFYASGVFAPAAGNYFLPVTDEVELLNIHGEINGAINDKMSFTGVGNLYKYTMAVNPFAWNMPDWDAKVGLKYNLRDKIIGGMELSAQGKRNLLVTSEPSLIFEAPAYLNLNLSAEYRYSKILSIWTKFNNISYNRYYEWAYYPSQRFLCMIGFTYSL